LAEFEPLTSRAVFVGPSAGYTFPDAFLKRFTEITVLDPDPMAGLLLKRRLRRLGITKLHIERRDQLLQPLLRGESGLVERLASDPGLGLIFGNVLGQTRFLLGESDFERFKAAFRDRIWPLLAGRGWLGFHDRLSGKLAPTFPAPHRAPSRLDDASVLRLLYPTDPGAGPVELFDHQSDGFFPSDAPHVYFNWQIERERWHLIEGVSSRPR
jgi:hypothetical protein